MLSVTHLFYFTVRNFPHYDMETFLDLTLTYIRNSKLCYFCILLLEFE